MTQKGKRRQKPGSVVERSKAPDSKKLLSWEIWYTNVCVDSNPNPIRKRFENDEAESWADKFCHTGTSIQDDSAKQKKTKKSQSRLGFAKSSGVRKVVWGSQSRLGLTSELFQTTQNKIPRGDTWNTNARMALNANLYKWMTQTVEQIKALKCKFNPI